MKTILIADDEPNIRSSLGTAFRLEGYRVETAADGGAALAAMDAGGIDLVVLDLQMPVLDGMEVLRELRRRGQTVPVMILTAHGSYEKAMEAARLGAFDFAEKPPVSEVILHRAANALRQASLEEENRELRGEVESRYDMIGSSPPMQRLYEQIRRVAPTQARVLIIGENGTGKELVARAIHRNSPRSRGPFARVNCAAIPRELFESELFGHERGAFTGATQRRVGKFVRAHGGTLFLDEVGEIPPPLQPKLLRALESGEVEPVGGSREVKVDVRVVAATNRDLDAAVAAGAFRQDLYHRLKVVEIAVPPLRERREDIPALVRAFLERASQENNLRPRRLAEKALHVLREHDYPGNVRELRNLIERLVILTAGEEIGDDDAREALPARPPGIAPVPGSPLRRTMADLEREVIRAALERNDWRMSATARELGLERSHLYKKVKALGIARQEP